MKVREWDAVKVFDFSDGSRCRISGRGANHRIQLFNEGIPNALF